MTTTADDWRVCNHCGRPKPIEQFRVVARATGRRSPECNYCHAERERVRRKRQRRVERGAALDRFAARVCGTSTWRRVEGAADDIIRRFGGIERFAEAFFGQYEKTKPGSRKRLDMLLGVLRMSQCADVLRAEEARANADSIVDESDIQRGMHEAVKNLVQAEPALAIEAASRLGWTIIPPDADQEVVPA